MQRGPEGRAVAAGPFAALRDVGGEAGDTNIRSYIVPTCACGAVEAARVLVSVLGASAPRRMHACWDVEGDPGARGRHAPFLAFLPNQCGIQLLPPPLSAWRRCGPRAQYLSMPLHRSCMFAFVALYTADWPPSAFFLAGFACVGTRHALSVGLALLPAMLVLSLSCTCRSRSTSSAHPASRKA